MAAEVLTREQRRSRRRREVRKTTESVKRLTKRELHIGALLYPDERPGLPATRGDCAGTCRPCPLVSCKWHLYIDVSPRTGASALDVADRAGTTLEDVGAIMNLTRERIRQVEVKALAKVARRATLALRELAEEGPDGRRRLPILEAAR